jgi:predicted dithiol-disulfide oxidoreductase (DUF899 family)
MGAERIHELESEIMERAQELHRLRRESPDEPVQDYALVDRDGSEVRLSSLFGDREDLLLVHNMGRSCPYCTLWADSLDGVLPHLEDRAAFVVVSPDTPREQAEFAASRGWRFRMVSDRDRAFTRAMGFWTGHEGREGPMPGFSTFRRNADGSVVRVASGFFGPGDLYLGLWHLIANLHGGAGTWGPKFTYGDA